MPQDLIGLQWLLISCLNISLLSNTPAQLEREWIAPYLLDLNPCDFFLWGYLKGNVYSKTPRTLEELEQLITGTYVIIPVDKLQKVAANFILQQQHVIVTDGGHLENIVI